MQMQLFDLTPDSAQTVTQNESLAKCAARFMAHCRVAKSLSPHTLRAYEGDLSLLIRDVGPDAAPTGIDRERLWQHVRWLREERKLGEASVKRRLATLRIFFRWLEAESVVPLSIFHRLGLGIRLPRRLPRALDALDLRRLLEAVEPDRPATELTVHDALVMRTAVVILFATGLRISELVSVRLDNVSVDSSDSRQLPWTTTKQGLVDDAEVFLRTKQEMQIQARPVLDFLTRMYPSEIPAEGVQEREILAKATPAALSELPKTDRIFKTTSVAQPVKATTNIQYRKATDKVNRVKQKLGRTLSASQIGSKTFDYYFDNECAE